MIEFLKNKVNPNLIKLKSYQAGKPIETLARDYGLVENEIIKLASNESPLGPSTKALETLKASLAQVHIYPDADFYKLRQKLATIHNLDSDEIVFGAGSNEVLFFLAQAFMDSKSSIVVSAHSFVIYKILAQSMGCEVIEVPTKGLAHDTAAMAEAIREDTNIVFLCNPNNPTGTLIEQKEIEGFLEKIPNDILVVFDEAYAEICLGHMPETSSYRLSRPTITLRSFSKSYGLAGLRIGYGISHNSIIAELEKLRQPFNVNLLAQNTAFAALGY